MARLPWVASIVVLLASAPALAQSSGADVATAQALFDEGKRLMADKRFAEACPKLVESQRLDPGGGTLLAIALCHEGEGRWATAWGDFNLALSEARRESRAERVKACEQHIHALEPKLSRLRVVVDAKAAGEEVTRDGERLGEGQLGTALPVDPGDHAIAARAPGKKDWSETTKVTGEGTTVEIHVPALQDAPAPPPPVVAPPPTPTQTLTPPQSPPPTQTPPPPPESSDRLTWTLVTGGVGVIGVGLGTVFGLRAMSKFSDEKTACPGGKCPDAASRQLGVDAGHAADASTVSFVVGGVGLAAAAVIWFWPHDPQDKTGVRVTPLIGTTNGIAIGGAL